MKPPPFDYKAPDTLEEALALTTRFGYEAKLLAGGQSLVPMMNFRLVQPAVLIDLNRVDSLNYIHKSRRGGVKIGAMTRQSQVEHHPLVRERAPLLQEAIPYIAHSQIRNRGTIGGSLVHADPASELPAISLALGARYKARSSAGPRWINSGEFFMGMFTTSLRPDEVLVEIEYPPVPPRTGWGFAEFSRRKGDYALLGVAVMLTLDPDRKVESARLVYLNAGDGPVEAPRAADSLVGNRVRINRIREAAAIAASEEIQPMGSVHGSIAYQRHLANVLTIQALNQAYKRAKKRLNN